MATFIVVAMLIGGGWAIWFMGRRLRVQVVERPLMALAGALRCVTCCTNWPRVCDPKGRALFAPCPECSSKGLESRLDTIMNATAIDLDEAWSRKRHADFDKFYESEWPKSPARAAKERALELAALAELAVDLEGLERAV